MTFISLLAALLLDQWRPLRVSNRVHGAFGRYVTMLSSIFNRGQYRDGVISWVLAVAPFALGVMILYWALRHASGMLAVLLNIAVLYVALGFRQFSHFYTDVMQALRTADLARAREILGAWRGKSTREFSDHEIACVAIEQGLVRAHRHVFGVMAWFVLLGPAGAIIYRIAALLNDRWSPGSGAPDDPYGLFASRAYTVIDWVPARLTAISFAVAGDFMGAVECWREQAASWRSQSQGIVLAAAAGALGIRLGGVLHEVDGIEYRPQLGDGDEADVDFMQAAIGLAWRAWVLWMFLVLLVTIASWF